MQFALPTIHTVSFRYYSADSACTQIARWDARRRQYHRLGDVGRIPATIYARMRLLFPEATIGGRAMIVEANAPGVETIAAAVRTMNIATAARNAYPFFISGEKLDAVEKCRSHDSQSFRRDMKLILDCS